MTDQPTPAADAARLAPAPRAIADAPRDGTMLRLWVRYPEGASWTPLDDARESWTIGLNNFDNIEEDRWQVVGWCWSHDHLVEAADDVEVLGWLPFHGEASPAVQPAAGREDDDPAAWAIAAERAASEEYAAHMGDPEGRDDIDAARNAAAKAIEAHAIAALSTPALASGEIHGEVTDEWAERFCEAVNWSPDGQECKTVEGEFRCVSFRDLAKGYILAAIATNPNEAHPPAQASESVHDGAWSNAIEAAAEALERQIPPAAGGPMGHTNTVRVFMLDALKAIRALSAPQTGDVITSAELIANTDSARGAVRMPGETEDRRIYGQPEAKPSKARKWVDDVATRDAAVAYRARIACDILEGFTAGIDGDRLGELARWTTQGRALDQAALLRVFAAPWIAAQEEAGWVGDPDAQAQDDYERHTITARVHGATSYPPQVLERIFAKHNQLESAAEAVSAIRPNNWDDGEDPEQQKAWTALDEALK